jgi:hypothetical protein
MNLLPCIRVVGNGGDLRVLENADIITSRFFGFGVEPQARGDFGGHKMAFEISGVHSEDERAEPKKTSHHTFSKKISAGRTARRRLFAPPISQLQLSWETNPFL